MGKHLSTSKEKAEWLANHPEIWKGWPMGTNDARILDAMRKDGLVSPGAHNYDVQDLGKLIGEARAIIKRGRHGRR